MTDIEITAATQAVSDHWIAVAEFARKAGNVFPEKPTPPPQETRELCARLVLEEAVELVHALGCRAFVGGEELKKQGWDIDFSGEPSLPEVANEAADVRVVATFAMVACGIADESVQNAVDQANLAKFGPGGYKDPTTGKWQKPPGHKKPDFDKIISLQQNGGR